MSGGLRLGPRRGAAGAAEKSEAYYRKVADQLIEQTEKGTVRWTQIWQLGEKAMPRYVVTGEAYRGGNSVWPAGAATATKRWGTYKQMQSLGG